MQDVTLLLLANVNDNYCATQALRFPQKNEMRTLEWMLKITRGLRGYHTT